MKEFNLDEYLKNLLQKVVTRDGRNVKIICTNYESLSPIIAEIEGDNVSRSFRTDGRYYVEGDSPKDLFFAPTKREGWINIYKRMSNCLYVEESIYSSKEYAIKNKFGDSYVTTIKIEWEE